MYYLIQNNKIVGSSLVPFNKIPHSFSIVEGPDVSVDEVYFNGIEVVAKPSKPQEENSEVSYNWDESANQWVQDIPPSIQQTTNWDAFTEELNQTPIWEKVWELSGRNSKGSSALNMLLRALDVTKKESHLEFAINNLRTLLVATSGFEDLTELEISFINEKLAKYNFNLRIS